MDIGGFVSDLLDGGRELFNLYKLEILSLVGLGYVAYFIISNKLKIDREMNRT